MRLCVSAGLLYTKKQSKGGKTSTDVNYKIFQDPGGKLYTRFMLMNTADFLHHLIYMFAYGKIFK